MNLIEEAMVEHWGRRCPDFEPACVCCKAWLEYDSLKAPVRVVSLRSALVFCGEAIDTGRSEPLFAARDLIRNTLEDDEALRKETDKWT